MKSLGAYLQERGFIAQTTASLDEIFVDKTPRTIYHGIDPTADSAHVGNFVVWMLLRHLVNAGHRIVFLVGGGTGLIGDPKPDVERSLADEEVVAGRVEAIRLQAESFFGTDNVTVVNNALWLREVSLITFLRDIGKHFTVNELIKKEAIAKRLAAEEGLSYTEFAYPLLQAFDYLTLFDREGVTLQVGGSDQWGNIVAGVDLVRKMRKAEVHAVTVPLVIDKVTGKKFGKSEGNAVWLDAKKTTPFAFYQFWMNTADVNVDSYLKLFSLLSLEEISDIAREHSLDPGKRLAQKKLSHAVTALVHGSDVAARAERVSECLFGNIAVADLDERDQDLLLTSAPVVRIQSGTALVDVLLAAELATSKREARMFIEEGAVVIDGTRETVDRTVNRSTDGDVVQIRRGKKHIALVVLE